MRIENKACMSESYLNKLKELTTKIEEELLDLDLSEFKGINIEYDSSFPSLSDGRTNNKTIILPKNRTENNLDNKIDMVKSTIIHELYHIDLSNRLPRIHSEFSTALKTEKYIKGYTILTYIEYITHLKSTKYENEELKNSFIKSINRKKWNFENEEDKIYMIKAAPYIIARDPELLKIENKILKNNLSEIKRELERLNRIEINDDYFCLSKLEKIVKKYIIDY